MQTIRAFVLGVLCLFGVSAGASVIDNTATYDGFSTQGFGQNYGSTFGQTFLVGSDRYLTSFTMYLNRLEGSSVSFKAYVYRWGSRAVGPQLYSSPIQHLTTTGDAPVAFTFDTGFTELISGFKFVVFLSTSELTEPEEGISEIPLDGPVGAGEQGVDGTIKDGEMVYTTNGNDFGALTTTIWDGIGPGRDVLFKAAFAASDAPNDVPEPGSFALLGLGLAALAVARRRTSS